MVILGHETSANRRTQIEAKRVPAGCLRRRPSIAGFQARSSLLRVCAPWIACGCRQLYPISKWRAGAVPSSRSSTLLNSCRSIRSSRVSSSVARLDEPQCGHGDPRRRIGTRGASARLQSAGNLTSRGTLQIASPVEIAPLVVRRAHCVRRPGSARHRVDRAPRPGRDPGISGPALVSPGAGLCRAARTLRWRSRHGGRS